MVAGPLPSAWSPATRSCRSWRNLRLANRAGHSILTRGLVPQLEDRGIPADPVGSPLVDGLQAPIAMGPACPERGIALMDLFQQVRDGFPAERGCHLRAQVDVDSRDEEMSAWRDESRNLPQALLCFRRPHVTEKPVGHDDVLRTQGSGEAGIRRIADAPADPFLDPRLDAERIGVPV